MEQRLHSTQKNTSKVDIKVLTWDSVIARTALWFRAEDRGNVRVQRTVDTLMLVIVPIERNEIVT